MYITKIIWDQPLYNSSSTPSSSRRGYYMDMQGLTCLNAIPLHPSYMYSYCGTGMARVFFALLTHLLIGCGVFYRAPNEGCPALTNDIVSRNDSLIYQWIYDRRNITTAYIVCGAPLIPLTTSLGGQYYTQMGWSNSTCAGVQGINRTQNASAILATRGKYVGNPNVYKFINMLATIYLDSDNIPLLNITSSGILASVNTSNTDFGGVVDESLIPPVTTTTTTSTTSTTSTSTTSTSTTSTSTTSDTSTSTTDSTTSTTSDTSASASTTSDASDIYYQSLPYLIKRLIVQNTVYIKSISALKLILKIDT